MKRDVAHLPVPSYTYLWGGFSPDVEPSARKEPDPRCNNRADPRKNRPVKSWPVKMSMMWIATMWTPPSGILPGHLARLDPGHPSRSWTEKFTVQDVDGAIFGGSPKSIRPLATSRQHRSTSQRHRSELERHQDFKIDRAPSDNFSVAERWSSLPPHVCLCQTSRHMFPLRTPPTLHVPGIVRPEADVGTTLATEIERRSCPGSADRPSMGASHSAPSLPPTLIIPRSSPEIKPKKALNPLK